MITYRFEYIKYKTTGLRSLFFKTVIKDTTLTLKTGKMSAIMGKTGSGKTSILYRLGLIENNAWDRYNLNGVDIHLDKEEEKAYYRSSKIAYVYQDNNMFDDLTLLDNFKIIEDISSLHVNHDYYLELVGLEKELLNHKVNELSGGEKQRAALALSLIKEPELLLLDEPTSKLDIENKNIIIELLKRIQKQTNLTVVIVTHDQELADICDEIFLVENQKIKQIKSCEQEGTVIHKELTKSKQPKGYLKKMFMAHYKSYLMILITLSLLVSLAECVAYAGNQFLKDQAEALASIPDTTILVVNNGSDLTHIQDYEGNEYLSKEEIDAIVSNEHITMALPIFYQKQYLVLSDDLDGFMEDYHTSNLTVDEYMETKDVVPYYVIYIPLDYFSKHIKLRTVDLNDQIFDASNQSNSYVALTEGLKDLIIENSKEEEIDGYTYYKTITYTKGGENLNYRVSDEYGYNQGNDSYSAQNFQSKLIDAKSTITYEDNEYSLVFNEFEDLGVENLFSDLDYVVYKSIDSIEDLEDLAYPIEDNKMYMATSSYLLTIDDYHNLDEVVNELKSISDDLGIRYDHSSLSYYQEILLSLDTFIDVFYILLIPLLLFAFIILIYKYFQSRVYDIGLLKTYGLSHEMIYGIYRRLFAYVFMIVYGISTLLLCLEVGILRLAGIYDQSIFIMILGITSVILVISYLYAMLYVEYLVDQTEAASLLKNN